MNLSSTIRRDGTKVFYLNVSDDVEAKQPSFASVLIRKIKEKFLHLLVWKINKTNQHRCAKKLRY